MNALHQSVRNVLATIEDPEMPISIVDLGMVEDVRVDDGAVTVRLLPTFVGCPALDLLRQEVERKTSGLPGVHSVQVDFTFDPPWTPARISAAGRRSLAEFGVTVPAHGGGAAGQPVLVQLGGLASANVDSTSTGHAGPNVGEAVNCPFCGADRTHMESPFGPTRCRMIYYCEACKNQFEHMKRLG